MNGYQKFQQIMADIKRKEELVKLKNSNNTSKDVMDLFSNIFGMTKPNKPV